jgi:hypothetical protein
VKLKVAVVAVAASILLALTPYTLNLIKWGWQYDPANYPKIAAWAGCHAAVAVNPDESPITSYYSSTAHVLVVGTHEDDQIPYYAGLIILLHETGHCLQDEEGWLDKQTDIVVVELDADRRAADLACGMNLDGRGLLVATFEWAKEVIGYNGDPDHGTLEMRESQAANAHVCDKTVGQ